MEKCPTSAAEAIGLDADDWLRLTSLYNGRLAEHGASVQTVGWRSAADQALRFDVLCRGLDLRNQRVLDLGCGLGDFVAWAESRFGPDFDYIGMDLAEKLIESATQRFGGPRRKFIADTLGPTTDVGSLDAIVSSGALSFRTSDNMKTMRSLLTEAWDRTRGALCVNFLSSYVDYQLPKNFHYKPEEVFSFAKSLSRWVILHHDYPLYEFTIQVFRNASMRPEGVS
jgi:SAM-dependent methyltransferase